MSWWLIVLTTKVCIAYWHRSTGVAVDHKQRSERGDCIVVVDRRVALRVHCAGFAQSYCVGSRQVGVFLLSSGQQLHKVAEAGGLQKFHCRAVYARGRDSTLRLLGSNHHFVQLCSHDDGIDARLLSAFCPGFCDWAGSHPATNSANAANMLSLISLCIRLTSIVYGAKLVCDEGDFNRKK